MKKERRDMSDKELDEFFLKKAQNPEIPYQRMDWELMKGKLDRHSPTGNGKSQGGRYNGWIITLFALMFLTGGGLWWNYYTGHQENPLEPLANSLSKVREMAPKQDPIKMGPDQNSGNTQRSESSTELAKANELIKSEEVSDIETTNRGFGEFSRGLREEYSSRKENFRPITQQRNQAINGPGLAERKLSFGNQFSKNLLLTLQEIHDLLTDSTYLKRNEIPSVSESETDKSRINNKKFSLALSISPDVSALKIKDIVGMGTNIGLNLEYFIHPNISLNAGAMYAFKTYKGGAGYYTGYVPGPIGILGDCWMLDLPLNFRYYAINSGWSRWYISTGTTSYIMLREKYDLEYASSKGGSYERRVEVKNGSDHYFNIVNLSVGYERVLSDKIAIQVEPYFKLPLNGIGLGKINLKSAGALISLKYNW